MTIMLTPALLVVMIILCTITLVLSVAALAKIMNLADRLTLHERSNDYDYKWLRDEHKRTADKQFELDYRVTLLARHQNVTFWRPRSEEQLVPMELPAGPPEKL